MLNVDDETKENYVAEHINGDVSLWAPVKKQNNKMFMSGDKKQTEGER